MNKAIKKSIFGKENEDHKLERSRLRRCLGWRCALMDLILEVLVKESSIKRTIGKHSELISLKE